ncbi:MAG: MFS transporter, partial [Actinobacteria bacterium]
MARAASAAEEIAALRGTRPATLKDLLTHPSFSRLWRAMLVSSLGDWVGFVAVASLVADLGGKRLGSLAVAGVMLARLLPSVIFGPFAGVLVRPAQAHGVLRHRPRHDVRVHAVRARPVLDLPAVLLHRVPVAAVDPGQGRQHPEPGPPATAGQRQLGGTDHHVRHLAAGRLHLYGPGRRLGGDRTRGQVFPRPPAVRPAVARRVHVLLLGPHGVGAGPPAEPDDAGPDGHRRQAQLPVGGAGGPRRVPVPRR